MPRREILSPAQREALLAIPVDLAGLIEHYVLSEQDISLVRQRRGDHNRLGIAVQLALLRFPGSALQGDETPPKRLNKGEARKRWRGQSSLTAKANSATEPSKTNVTVRAVSTWSSLLSYCGTRSISSELSMHCGNMESPFQMRCLRISRRSAGSTST